MDAKGFMPDEAVIAGIRKDIEQYESQRAGAYAAVKWRVPVFFAVLIVPAVILAFAFNSFADPNEQWFSSPHMFLYVGTLAAAIFVYSAAMRPATKLKQSFREHVLPIVFGFIGDMRYGNGTRPDSFDRLPKQATGSFNRQSFDDVVAGKYEDFPFELYEASLQYGSGKSTQTVFKGVVVAFETITPFPGLLVATRRAGQISKFFSGIFSSSALEEVQCGLPGIDEVYEFRTDNSGAARPLVAGRLAKALQWLSESWPGEPARVALQGRDGFLLLRTTKNFFELPGISQPLDYKTHVEPMVADMVSLLATVALVRKVGQPDDAPQTAQP
jgi:hypothetical protein